MVSNTQRIEALERRVGELDGLDETLVVRFLLYIPIAQVYATVAK